MAIIKITRHTWLLVAVGVAAGLLSGLFGVGGGILIVPGLVMIAGLDQRLAHGTSLAAVLPISAASLITYWGQGHVDWPVAACLAVGAVSGSLIGTHLLAVASKRALAFVFSSVLVISAIRLFISTHGSGRATLNLAAVIALVLVGLATGALAGLLGVGGGVVMVPAMIVFFGIAPVIAKGTSIAVIIPTAIMGTWRNRANGNLDVRAAVITGFGGVASAILGGFIAAYMSDTVSNVLFATLMLAIAARTIWQQRNRAQPPTNY